MIRTLTFLMLFLPSVLATAYFGLLASDRYVSEAQFVVRSASKPTGMAGFGAILQMTGLSQARDDVFAVQSYLTSRNAIQELSSRVPLVQVYGVPEADPLARFPSPVYGNTLEELHRYLGWMITTIYSSTSGITTLRVQAFRPEDAQQIAVVLLELGEKTVNDMNLRIQSDTVRLAEAEVKRTEERLIAAQLAITRFRNAELSLDPIASSVVVTELVARLGAELAQAEAQLREVESSAATNPMIGPLRARVAAIKAQVAQERQRISTDSEGLADKLAVYERLVLDREFAKQTLAVATRSLEAAQAEGRRQQLYLERIVEPVVADRAMAPERLRSIASVLGLNFVFAIVGWLVFSGVREHASEAK